MLHVAEIFYSLQGESRWAGFPCVFIRLAGCNLRCDWCDTEYSFGPGVAMTIEEILSQAESHPCRLVEITGGEPLLQAECIPLMRTFLDRGWRVLLETGGSVPVGAVPAGVAKVLDVKCPGSGESHRNLWENLAHLRPGDDVKFVVKDRVDFDYACSVIREHRLSERTGVGLIFSPVWGGIDLRDLAAWLLASGLDARLQVQLHKIIWGADARGV